MIPARPHATGRSYPPLAAGARAGSARFGCQPLVLLLILVLLCATSQAAGRRSAADRAKAARAQSTALANAAAANADPEPAPGPEGTPLPEAALEPMPVPPKVGSSGEIINDLSQLPEVDDRPPQPTPPPRTQVQPLPYIGQMLEEPSRDFVPNQPNHVDPRIAWESIFAPPLPTPAELRARRMRGIGAVLIGAGAVFSLVTVGVLVSGRDSTAARDFGFGLAGLSGASLAVGIPLVAVGVGRVRAARLSAAGLSSWAPPQPPQPPQPFGRQGSLAFAF